MCGSLRFKGRVSDPRSSALAVTYIGFRIKSLANLGFSELEEVPQGTVQITTVTS